MLFHRISDKNAQTIRVVHCVHSTVYTISIRHTIALLAASHFLLLVIRRHHGLCCRTPAHLRAHRNGLEFAFLLCFVVFLPPRTESCDCERRCAFDVSSVLHAALSRHIEVVDVPTSFAIVTAEEEIE